jgi:predicted house-cleaning noncanonical NTP pyrophosphatase (MazG superfamily)
MPKFKFNKLVRDKIVEQQIASGAQPHYYKLNNKQHGEELIKKIAEEAEEIANAKPCEMAAEIADVQQAIDDLKRELNLTNQDISKAQEIKNKKSGPFRKGIFVDYIEIGEDNEWVPYYRKNADRYPEIK